MQRRDRFGTLFSKFWTHCIPCTLPLVECYPVENETMFVNSRNDNGKDDLRQISGGVEIAVDDYSDCSSVPSYSNPNLHRAAVIRMVLTNRDRCVPLIWHSLNSHLAVGNRDNIGFRLSTKLDPILNSNWDDQYGFILKRRIRFLTLLLSVKFYELWYWNLLC